MKHIQTINALRARYLAEGCSDYEAAEIAGKAGLKVTARTLNNFRRGIGTPTLLTVEAVEAVLEEAKGRAA